MSDSAQHQDPTPQTPPGEGETSSAAAAPSASGQADGGGNPAVSGAMWFDSLNDDLKGYVQNKGWKDEAAVVESYRNAEKLLGTSPDQVIKLPKHDAPAEEWNASVWDRLGRPEKPEGYGFQAPEGEDNSFAEWASGTFHELGVPRKMGEAIAQGYEEFAKQVAEKQQADQQAAVEAEVESLKSKWGAAHEQNMNRARQAAQAVGVDAETIDALESSIGYAKVMEMFNTIGSKMGEGTFVNGDAPGGFGVMSPEQAKSRIQALRNDQEFIKRYSSGDLEARDEMEKLHKWAYPEQ